LSFWLSDMFSSCMKGLTEFDTNPFEAKYHHLINLQPPANSTAKVKAAVNLA